MQETRTIRKMVLSTPKTDRKDIAYVDTLDKKSDHLNGIERINSSSSSGSSNDSSKTMIRNGDGPIRRLMRHARNRRKRRSLSAPPTTGPRRRLLEDHFCVTPDKKVVLPGVPKHDDDWARDSHDFFNLVVLVPICVLNAMNWNWDIIINKFILQQRSSKKLTIVDSWTGEWFEVFFYVTASYFLVDLLWVCLIPRCVKSPATIIQHHLATILYIMIPYYVTEYQWGMGACMSVEINTWFLIARRVFNKQGFPPWIIDLSCISFRVKLISIFFYLSWIVIRCTLYPYLILPFYNNWVEYSIKVGSGWNIVAISLPLHILFCLLNLKWTYDLLMSKIRYLRRRAQYSEYIVSKGL